MLGHLETAVETVVLTAHRARMDERAVVALKTVEDHLPISVERIVVLTHPSEFVEARHGIFEFVFEPWNHVSQRLSLWIQVYEHHPGELFDAYLGQTELRKIEVADVFGIRRADEATVAIDAIRRERAQAYETASVASLRIDEDSARVLTILGRHAEAVAVLEAALAQAEVGGDGWRVQLLVQLVHTLRAKGEPELAKPHVREAARLLAAGADVAPGTRADVEALAQLDR